MSSVIYGNYNIYSIVINGFKDLFKSVLADINKIYLY